MCGFAGTFAIRGALGPPDLELVRRMAALLAHRGPDDRGEFFDGSVALGFRRLSIIDLEGGHQPMTVVSCFGDPGFRPVVVFNGEVYNYVELRAELCVRGHRFRTASDTEAILHLYEEDPEGFVERLRGMFALALWDPQRERLVLARDRIGKKPLYVARRSERLYFASEPKSLRLVPGIGREIDWGALDALLSLRFVPGNRSVFQGIRQLAPAHVEVWGREGAVTERRYWALRFEPKEEVGEKEALERLSARLEEAVRLRLRSDVPVAAFLSGGVDSGTVVGLMAEALPRPTTFTVGVDEESWNELPLARETASRIGAVHHEVRVGPEVAAELPNLLWHLDEPFADRYALAVWAISRRAAEEVKVVLTGDGGDEVFAGYDRYGGHRWLELYRIVPRPLRSRAIPALLGALPVEGSRWLRALEWANGLSLLPPDRAYACGLAHFRFGVEAKRSLYSPRLFEVLQGLDPLAPVAEAYRSAPASDPLDRMIHVDSLLRLPNYTLSRMDRITMAFGLEARSPILDHVLMEEAARLPVRLKSKLGSRKVLLRRLAARWLPPSVLRAPKRGFGLPVGEWLRNALGEPARRLCVDGALVGRGIFRPEAIDRLFAEHSAGTGDHTERLWMVLNVEVWYRVAMEGESPDTLGQRLLPVSRKRLATRA
jgi:asparagine synthase (glutamine-hydrolysing)